MPGSEQKILITGGLGNLGSWITAHFSSKKEFSVTVLANSDRAVDISDPYEKIFCDITDKTALGNVLKDRQFDHIIHLASLNETFLEGYDKNALLVNAYGTRNLLEICRENKPGRFIYFSTFHVYGKDGGLITEADAAAPLNDYAITHYFAEEYTRMFSRKTGMPHTILRLSNSYGSPKDLNSSKWYLLFNDLCRQAAMEKKIELRTNGKALRDFIYMGDVCDVLERIMTGGLPANEVYNLGSGKALSLLEVAQLVADARKEETGGEIPVLINTGDRNSYPATLEFSIDKLKNATGFTVNSRFREEAKKIFRQLLK